MEPPLAPAPAGGLEDRSPQAVAGLAGTQRRDPGQAIRRSRKITATVQSARPSLLVQWPGATPHASPDQVVRRVWAPEEPDLCVMQRSDTGPNPIPWPWRFLLNCQRATVVAPPFSGPQDSQHVIWSNLVLRLLRHQAGIIRRPGLIAAPAPPLSGQRAVEEIGP